MIIITSVDRDKKFFLRQEDILEMGDQQNWTDGGGNSDDVYIVFKYSVEKGKILWIRDIQLIEIYDILMKHSICELTRNFDWR